MFQQLYTSILRDWPDELALFPGVNVEARPLSTPTSNESAPAQVPSIPAVSAVPDQVSGGTFSSDMPTNVVPTMVHAMQIERAEKQQQQQQHAHAHHQSRLDDDWRIRFAELKLGRVIGAGSFGIVHAGVWRGSEVAIKRFTLTELLPDAVREFHAETMLMSQLHHRNIVLFLGACLEPPHLCLITERLDMSVQDLLSSSAPLRISQMLLMAIDACRGVHALHSRQPPTLHRDIKSSNLLVDTSGELRVCVCDFGLARIRRRNQARLTLCGTTAWLAPEIVTSDGWTEKSDVYALAIVLYELFSRRLPYEHIQSPQTVMFQVVNDSLRPVIPATCPESVAALMQSAWAADPTVRPTVQCMIDELTRLLAYYRRHPTQDSFVVRATD
jgi:serine/threonine protein kinase